MPRTKMFAVLCGIFSFLVGCGETQDLNVPPEPQRIHHAFIGCMQQDGSSLKDCEAYARRLYLRPIDACEDVCDDRVDVAMRSCVTNRKKFEENIRKAGQLMSAYWALRELYRDEGCKKDPRTQNEEWCRGVQSAIDHVVESAAREVDDND